MESLTELAFLILDMFPELFCIMKARATRLLRCLPSSSRFLASDAKVCGLSTTMFTKGPRMG